MNIRTLTFAVIVLIVINIAALSTILYQRFARPVPFGLPAPFGRGAEMVGDRFMKNLGLTPEQRDKLKESRQYNDSLSRPLFKEIEQKRDLLFGELNKENPDTALINDIIVDIGTLQSVIQKTLIDRFLSDSKMLTPDQRKAFLKVIEERTRWMEQRPLGQMRGLRRDNDPGR